MQVPDNPKIYHIVHIDRLKSIADCGCLYSDERMRRTAEFGTVIGMHTIKERRLRMPLKSIAGLTVGRCVPFYFCPRSVMLYILYKKNHADLSYFGGQNPILHLEADLYSYTAWAEINNKRWAFTTSNAGASYFEDYCRIEDLHKIDWEAVNTRDWVCRKEGKQAEFLAEDIFPASLISRIGVRTKSSANAVKVILQTSVFRPIIEIHPEWYY